MAVKTVQAVINGQTYNLTRNSGTGKYEATITAPNKSSYGQANHYYDVTIKATDDAGNVTTKNSSDATLGNSLKLYVKEKVAPTQTITYPTSSALITNNKPAITWEVKDSDSGINPNSIGITINSGTKITSGITKTPITGGYRCSYTPASPLNEGSNVIKVDCADNDGNAATQVSVSFKVDTVPPTLNITSPVQGLITNKATVTVKGTTNDATSSPVLVVIKVNEGEDISVTVGSDGSFTKDITLVEGNNTIKVVATDSAKKQTTVTRTVELDTKPPVFGAVTLTPNPVDSGKTFVISVEVTDA